MGARDLICVLLLILCGLVGNYFSLPLFFGADFLFGSIAVLLILYYYGIRWGLAAALVVHSYTFFLWGHAYACITFVGEVLFVGIGLRRGFRNLLALDGFFWLLLGMPLAWFFHGVLLEMDSTLVRFIMLKQAINGVFNTMLVGLAVCLPSCRKVFRPAEASASISLQEILFNVFAMLVLLPTLFLTMLEARDAKTSLEDEVVAGLRTTSANLQVHLRFWYTQNLRAVQHLATLAGQSAMVYDDRLQHEVEVLHGAFPNFLALHVADTTGRTIAFSPRVNEKGESTIGRDFSDQLWFQDCQARKAFVNSEVHYGRVGVFSPIVTVAAPIFRAGEWAGTAAGPQDLAMVREMLAPYGQDKGMEITLTDARNKIIASTGQNTAPMQVRVLQDSDALASQEGRLVFWQPDDPKLPSMSRWKRSFYVLESSLGDELPWVLTLQAPVAPLQKTLYAMYIKNLTVMATLIALSLGAALFLSRWLTRPLVRLTQVSQDLPEKLADDRLIEWPASSTQEVSRLIANLRSMAESLVLHIHRLQERGNELSQANQTLQGQIEERRRSEEEREKMRDQLHQAQKMETVGRLAGGVAHDFNNMLSVIIGNAEMAQMRTGPSASVAKYLQEILKASSRSADLVRQLLAFARKQTISTRVLDLNDTISGLLTMLRRLIGEDIDLVWVPGRDLWSVKMDPVQIDQILVNLVVNARDAIAGTGTVTIVTGNVLIEGDSAAAHPDVGEGRHVVLSVSDTGTGMSREVQERLFEPFFTTKEVGKGTGLGLATVFGIVKQNNGFINVVSEPGQGTTFRVYLRPVDKVAVTRQEEPLQPVHGGPWTILMVEDETNLLEIGKTLLGNLGHTVLAASTPEEAIGLASGHQAAIHLLLSDVVMPGMNGRDLADKVRCLHPDIKVLFMSGYTSDVISHHGVLDEGAHFLQKPFSFEVLSVRLHEVMNGA